MGEPAKLRSNRRRSSARASAASPAREVARPIPDAKTPDSPIAHTITLSPIVQRGDAHISKATEQSSSTVGGGGAALFLAP